MELYSVIKNDGPGDVLFWKFIGEDFRTGSQLIVAENEEALFVRDGIIQEVFDGGKYTLSTNNYPFIDRLRASFSGGVSSFNCKVYFINKAHVLELYWGTDSPIQMRDPVYGIVTSIQARGSYTIQVEDSKKFVLKFVANNTQMKTNEEFTDKFRTVFMQKIKSTIPKEIRESGQEVLGVCERQEEFAEKLTPVMNKVMEEYGVRIVNFYIGALDIPMDDPSRIKLENAHANNAEIAVEGDNWLRIQGRDIFMATAQNEGAAGSMAGAGMGMGMGMAAGNAMGAIAASVFAPMQQNPAPTPPPPHAGAGGMSRFAPKKDADVTACPACGAQIPSGAKFCPECGAKNEQKKVFCSNCGAELQPTAKFCPECGSKRQ